jgi:signal transduction histidine kinase
MLQKVSITELGMMYTLHELNNPLTNILLCLDLLEIPSPENKKNPYYDIIKKNALAMGESVKDMYKCLAEKQQSTDGKGTTEMLTDMIRTKKKVNHIS